MSGDKAFAIAKFSQKGKATGKLSKQLFVNLPLWKI
jgi:hypothetical protein